MDPCPHCSQAPHDYAVVLQRKPLVFGGGSDQVTIAVLCPVTGMPIETTIVVPNNEQFERVVLPGQGDRAEEGDGIKPADPSPVSGDRDAEEYAEWVTASRTIGLDFGKTMLTTSSGAVAVYFAVLKYLGTSELSRSFSGVLSVLPPVLFLLAAAVFAAALRPKLAPVGEADFVAFRDHRLRQLGNFLTAGSALFGAAMALALCVYADALGLL
ncbi:hypothetical protein GCM10009743_38930 [Kribbella swartbergensis]